MLWKASKRKNHLKWVFQAPSKHQGPFMLRQKVVGHEKNGGEQEGRCQQSRGWRRKPANILLQKPLRVMDKLIPYPERYGVAVVETCRPATREERHCGLVFLSGWTSPELGNELRLCRESRCVEQQRSELLRQWWLGGWGERQGTMNEGPLAEGREEAKSIPSLQPPSRHLSLFISHEITPSGRLAEHLFLLIWREMQLEVVK